MTSTRTVAKRLVPLVAVLLGAIVGACGDANTANLLGGGAGGPGSSDDGGSDEATTVADGGTGDDGSVAPVGAPYEPVGPASYVPRVKNLMTGLAATDAEVNAVIADPNVLGGLVDTWIALPQFQGRMIEFFRNAFQQNNVDLASLTQQSFGINTVYNGLYSKALERNIMDSFPLTVWEMVKAGSTPRSRRTAT